MVDFPEPLAAARFAHQAEGFTLADMQGDVADRVDERILHAVRQGAQHAEAAEAYAQVLDVEKGAHVPVSAVSSRRWQLAVWPSEIV